MATRGSRSLARSSLFKGSDLWRRNTSWENEGFPGYVAVAIGNFADPSFPAPTIGVWEESRHPWVSLSPDTPPKRLAKQG
jgi:hypothetical protein